MANRYPFATYAAALPKQERDKFAATSIRTRDPRRAVLVYEAKRRREAVA